MLKAAAYGDVNRQATAEKRQAPGMINGVDG
jgi:hypothetical protein